MQTLQWSARAAFRIPAFIVVACGCFGPLVVPDAAIAQEFTVTSDATFRKPTGSIFVAYKFVDTASGRCEYSTGFFGTSVPIEFTAHVRVLPTLEHKGAGEYTLIVGAVTLFARSNACVPQTVTLPEVTITRPLVQVGLSQLSGSSGEEYENHSVAAVIWCADHSYQAGDCQHQVAPANEFVAFTDFIFSDSNFYESGLLILAGDIPRPTPSLLVNLRLDDQPFWLPSNYHYKDKTFTPGGRVRVPVHVSVKDQVKNGKAGVPVKMTFELKSTIGHDHPSPATVFPPDEAPFEPKPSTPGDPICTTDTNGTCDGDEITFTTPPISGIYTIIARAESNGLVSEDRKDIAVQFPIDSPTHPGCLSASPWYRLTGTETDDGKRHLTNHCGGDWLRFVLPEVARSYYEKVLPPFVPGTIGINDMSLPGGGLFDIKGNFDDIGGHVMHRVGNSVDIDHKTGDIDSPKAIPHYAVNDQLLDGIFKNLGFYRVPEADSIHYEQTPR